MATGDDTNNGGGGGGKPKDEPKKATKVERFSLSGNNNDDNENDERNTKDPSGSRVSIVNMVLAERLFLLEHVLVIELYLLEKEQAKLALMLSTVTLTTSKLLSKDGRSAGER